MAFQSVNPEHAVFAVLSFEGPDPYSLAGGLGIRVSKLSQALAEQGYETHLFFVGASDKEGIETLYEGKLIQHRWCQWISRYHPFGVYDGEEGKVNDFTASLPEYVVDTLARDCNEREKQLVVLARAESLGLSVLDVDLNGDTPEECIRELLAARYVDVANIRTFIPHELSRIVFACSDAVLADSLHEPFGLVGLEAMAFGGIAFMGKTGEDYARDLDNPVVLERSNSTEAAASVLYMHKHRQFAQSLRSRARSTAREFTWDRIISGTLTPKIQLLTWERRNNEPGTLCTTLVTETDMRKVEHMLQRLRQAMLTYNDSNPEIPPSLYPLAMP